MKWSDQMSYLEQSPQKLFLTKKVFVFSGESFCLEKILPYFRGEHQVRWLFWDDMFMITT